MAKHHKRTIWVFLALTTASGACWSDDSKDVTAGATASATTAGATTTEPGTESASSTSVGTSGTSGVSSTGSSTSPTEPTTGTTGCNSNDYPLQGGVECDVLNNCCPDGEKCMPYANDGGNSWNATKCMPIGPNPGKPGDPCTVEGSAVSGIDSCEAGAMCWNVDYETMMGYCIGFCDGDPVNHTCAEPMTHCVVSGPGVLWLCLPCCDPLLQDCPNGDLCLHNGVDCFICILDASGDMGVFGDPCEYANVCDPGLVCLDPEYVPGCQAAGCCSPFCELDTDYTPIPAPAPNCPDPQMACLNWFDPGTAPPGQEKVGVCGIPL